MKQALNVLNTVLFALAYCTLTPAQAAEPEPSFPESIELTASQNTLTKLGEYRYVYRLFFKLYDAALYAPAETVPDDILAARTDYRLQFRYLRKIDKSIILESAAKMLEKNLSPSEQAQIAERVARLNAAYTTVKPGDHSSLTYQTDVGTTLHINGTPMITIEGTDFARLYFTIWLGEQPLSTALRDELLGRRE